MMDKKLKRQLRHKAAFYAIFLKGNIIIVMLIAVCLSAAYQLFTFDNLHMQMQLEPLIISFAISFVFVYVLAMYTYSDIEAVSVDMQIKISEQLLDLDIRIKNWTDQINKDPAEPGVLDERAANRFDAINKKKRLIELHKELEKVPSEFG